MLQKIKSHLLSFTALTILATFGFSGVAVAQSPVTSGVCEGANNLRISTNPGANSCDAANTGTTEKVNSLITSIINIFSVIVGILAVIFIIFGGLKYITSGGDSGKVTSAKNTILYAIVGLIIVALAQFIVRFVLAKTAETTTG